MATKTAGTTGTGGRNLKESAGEKKPAAKKPAAKPAAKKPAAKKPAGK